MKICGKFLLLLKKIASRFSIWFNFHSFFYSAQISDWGLFLILWGKYAFLDEMKNVCCLFPVKTRNKRSRNAPEVEQVKTAQEGSVNSRVCFGATAHWAETGWYLSLWGHAPVRRTIFCCLWPTRSIGFSEAIKIGIKSFGRGGCGFLDAFACIQIITVTNVLFFCFCNF